MTEIVGEKAMYQDPDPAEIKPRNRLARPILNGLTRINRIDEYTFSTEPTQLGVKRYPPIQVQVERDPEDMYTYLRLGYRTWNSQAEQE